MRLSPEAIQRIRDNIEAEEAMGDEQFASDLQVLLDCYLHHVDTMSKSGKVGGKNRAANLTPERRSEIARTAANARWNKEIPHV